jgi:YesN/AraC family two-component response regulator
VTARHLSKVFKNERRVGFSEFSTTIRVEKARELLLVPSLRISDVAALLGYADSHYFSRVFKLRIGANPESFRSRPTGL